MESNTRMLNVNMLSKKFIRIIENYLINNMFPHSLIIASNSDEINYQSAIYLTCRLVCEDINWCEGKCNNCQRVISNSYPDFVILNLCSEKLKKEMIREIISKFSLSSLEITNKKIYLIQNIEDGSLEANNSLLKFLEEPPINTYAIITSKSINRVLPTIISRSQVLTLLPIDFEIVTTKLINEWKVAFEDAKLISNCFSDWNEIVANVDYAKFLEIKLLALDFITNFINDNNEDNYLLSNKINKLEKNYLSLFWKLIILIMKDSFLEFPQYFITQQKFIKEVTNKIANKQNYFLTIIYECLERLKFPVNKNLLVDYFIIMMLKI
ncbi:hypothetical protein [Spiroplasma endosymbiont of Clivina fossor]|uniref:hypothetical protein n=1 Tax=Spiroplasma endosymbiont of Clivina fossor TaxID=3066282 RepID=UPI00313E7D27